MFIKMKNANFKFATIKLYVQLLYKDILLPTPLDAKLERQVKRRDLVCPHVKASQLC